MASTALDVVGDINPSSLSINNRLLINNEGQWVGDAGPAGEAGPVGPEGPAGNDGVSVQVAMINEAGELVLTLSDGTTLNAGVARGADGAGGGEQGAAGEAGPAGEPGVGIESANINEGGDLVLTLTDATIVNAGNARGVEGAVGPAGEAGEAGPAGSAGISIDTAVINEGGGLDSYLD